MGNDRLTFGKNKQLEFTNKAEMFYVIGYLTKPDMFELKFEPNKRLGAREDEYRIHIYSIQANYPPALSNKHRKGRGQSPLHRINCNPFVHCLLLKKYGFVLNQRHQNVSAIRPNIPEPFLKDFDDGCNA